MSSSMTLARPVLRQSRASLRMAGRRFESNTTAKATDAAKDAAAKAQASATEYAAKAQEGLSRVTAAAGPAISGAAKGLASSLGKVGGRTGKVIGFVESTFSSAPHTYAQAHARLQSSHHTP
jgi:F-type H+-transporting ATPase subunit g